MSVMDVRESGQRGIKGGTRAAVVFALAAALLAGGMAIASAPAVARGWGRPGPEQREKMHKRFLAKRAEILRKEVGLDEATARKVEQVDDRFHVERRANRERMRASREALDRLLKADSDDQKAYARAVQGIMDAQKAMGDLKQRQMRAMRRFLTPKQQARLMVSIHRARRQMHRFMMRQHRRGGCEGPNCRRRGWGGGRGGGPGWGGRRGGQMGPGPRGDLDG